MENFGKTRPASSISFNNSLSEMKLKNFNKLQINGSITGYDINQTISSNRYSRNVLNEQKKPNNVPVLTNEYTKNLNSSKYYAFKADSGTVSAHDRNSRNSNDGDNKPVKATRNIDRDEVLVARNEEYDSRRKINSNRDSEDDHFEENHNRLNNRQKRLVEEHDVKNRSVVLKNSVDYNNDRNAIPPKPIKTDDGSFKKQNKNRKSRQESDDEEDSDENPDDESDESVIELADKNDTNKNEKIMEKLNSLVIPELKLEAQRLLSARKPISKFLLDFERSLSESTSTLNHVLMKIPHGQTLKCCIKRSSKRLPIYTMYLEKADGTYQKLLVGHTIKRIPSVQIKIYAIKTGEVDEKNLIPLGKLKTSLSANEFTLHGIINATDTGIDDSDDESELLERHLTINYKLITVFSKDKIQKFSFIIPKELKLTSTRGVNRYTNKPESNFFMAYANNDDAMPLYFETKEPKFNEQKGTYTLNFNGRVTETSAHNFQITTKNNTTSTVLQFGKIGKNTFICDYGYPLTAFQAFAVGLANLCR